MNTDEVMRITEKLSNFLSNEIAAMTRDERIFTPRDMENAVYQGIRAAYEAGEIAQQEKIKELAEAVAKEVGGQFWETHMLNTGLLKFLAAIRALPLSGAEESKK